MANTDGEAFVKFILEDGNIHDIGAMIETSQKYGVKKLILSMDMNIPIEKYPLYNLKVKEFINKANKYGLQVLRGAFFTPTLKIILLLFFHSSKFHVETPAFTPERKPRQSQLPYMSKD